ncbi:MULTISPECIES: NADPH:quinone reductase [Sphingobacterium]|nr:MULTISPECIES: NADPH:quinone reductase [Sphingobacterium]MCS4168456.1 NADPH2:quinone reductase [Sphingobacterium sp. BIGb0116]WSO16007.1 NADPH:quinone reductase [Sphingobacterium paramultivorum]
MSFEGKMKAAFYEKQGSAAEVLKVQEIPIPLPGPGQVRVKIAVSGVNPSDIKTRTGFTGSMPFSRIIPHQDGAGVIDLVGEGVEESRINQRVWIYEAQYGKSDGSAAEYAIVEAHRAVLLPSDVNFEVGASLGVPALTAHYCLFADGDIKGKKILVQGGAGAVGEAAILLAKWAGAWVATTVRDIKDKQGVLSKVADLVIHLGSENVEDEIRMATQGTGVSKIVEVDLAANYDVDVRCLDNSGTISTYSVSSPEQTVPVGVLDLIKRNVALRFAYVYTIPEEFKRKAVGDITNCLATGDYRPTIGKIFPLAQIDQAHEAVEMRKVKGKILVSL